ncbi:MAG TPA: hypothetical protein PLS23_11250 [Phycisphaerae bacterium]|nr:hypothetical protein [Phycisphaerae bacterium]
MAPKAKGRPPKFVNGRDGRPIPGLSRNKSTGTYYATYAEPRVYFGTDFDSALVKFRRWEMRQSGNMITLPVPSIPVFDTTGDGVAVEDFPLVTDADKGFQGLPIPEDAFWAAVTRAITEDVHYAAEKTGLPLDRLHKFQAPGPSLPLETIGTWFNPNFPDDTCGGVY